MSSSSSSSSSKAKRPSDPKRPSTSETLERKTKRRYFYRGRLWASLRVLLILAVIATGAMLYGFLNLRITADVQWFYLNQNAKVYTS